MAVGLTQQELAARASVGVRTVRELERARVRRPQRGTLELIADALGLAGAAREAFIATTRPAGGYQGGGYQSGRVGPWSLAAESWLSTVAPLPAVPELIGRDRDVADLIDLLASADLVVLVGLAGVGKTCLAHTVAHRCANRYPGGVTAVTISDGAGWEEVLAATASALRVERVSDLPDRCAGTPTLLVVDGVDRSPHAVTEAMGWLRSRVPALAILATSRHPVALPDVVERRVEPLAGPPPATGAGGGPPGGLEQLRRYPAVALFLTRLRQVRRRAVTDDEAPVVAEIVRRLGGLPLALELAAARGRVLELPELLARYGGRLLDLSAADDAGGSLRDAVGASYQLLDPKARWVLRQLSIFSGRWSLELAEALLGDAGQPGSARGTDVERVVDRLLGHGLVSARESGELRFGLLDVVRDYAAEACAASGELGGARRQHARALAEFAGRLAPELAGPTLPSAAARLDALASDLRAAIEHAVEHDQVTAVRLAAAIARWSRLRGTDRELRRTLRALLDDPRTADAERGVLAWAQLGVAMLAAEHGEGPVELPAAESALAAFTAAGDVDGELAARSTLCVLWQAVAGGYGDARHHAHALLALATREGRARETAVAENHLAWHDVRMGDLAAATERLERAARRACEAADVRLQVLTGANRAEVARLDGRLRDAVESGRRVMAELARFGDPGHRLRTLATVGRALAESGDTAAGAVSGELAAGGAATVAVREMIAGYLALAAADLGGAANRFERAATAPPDRYDARELLEALVGLAACTGPGERREAVVSRIAQVCRQDGLRLLPRDRALLARA